MDVTAPLQISKQIEAISAAVARASQDLNSIHSPTTEYESNWTAIQTKFDDAWERGLRCGSLADRSEVQKELVRLAHTQEALKAEYEADLETANSRYDARLKRVLPSLCEELVRVLGPSRLENVLRDLYPAADAHQGCSPEEPVDASPEDKRLGQGVKRKLRQPDGGRQKKQRETNGYKSRSRQRRPSITSAASLPRRHTRQRDGSPHREILDAITPGEVYLAYWGRSKALLAVLLLPTEGLDKVGVHNETIGTLGLLEEIPSCYEYDPSSGRLNWRQGYRDGETLVPDREYPVMYFDGKAFPTRSKVGWVAARDLLDFDLKAIGRTISNYRDVRKYLEKRDQGRPQGPNTASRTSAAGVTTVNPLADTDLKSPDGKHAPPECQQDQQQAPAIAAPMTAELREFPRQDTHAPPPSVPASEPQESSQGILAGTLEPPGHDRDSSAGEELLHEACITVRTPEPRMEETAPQVRPIFDTRVPETHDAWDSSLVDLTMVAAEAECFLCQQEAANQTAQDEPIQVTSPRRELDELPAGARSSPEYEPLQHATMEDSASGDSTHLRLLQEFLASTDEGQAYSHSLDRLLELLTAQPGTLQPACHDALRPPSPPEDASLGEDRSRTLSCSEVPNPPPGQDDERQPAFACSKGSSSKGDNGRRPQATDDLRLPPIRGKREPTVHLPSFLNRPPILTSCGTGTRKGPRPLLPKPLTSARIS